jgi:hypothetical protein
MIGVLVDIQSGREIKAGSIITDFTHEQWRLISFLYTPTGGKVYVEDPQHPGRRREFYARVFGCIVEPDMSLPTVEDITPVKPLSERKRLDREKYEEREPIEPED